MTPGHPKIMDYTREAKKMLITLYTGMHVHRKALTTMIMKRGWCAHAGAWLCCDNCKGGNASSVHHQRLLRTYFMNIRCSVEECSAKLYAETNTTDLSHTFVALLTGTVGSVNWILISDTAALN